MIIRFVPIIVKFCLYLIFLIPSFVLYHLLFDRNLRRALNSHVFIVLLCEISNYPWMLVYYIHGDTWQRSYFFCQLWAFIDWSFYVLQIMFFAWVSIERYIVILHDGWVATRRKRFFIHYLPYYIVLLFAFVTIRSKPGLNAKFKGLFRSQRMKRLIRTEIELVRNG